MDAALEAMHTWKYALLRWRINNKHFSESLEQLASYNGADMYKYNMIYTFKINQDVLTPESYDIFNFPKNKNCHLRVFHIRWQSLLSPY